MKKYRCIKAFSVPRVDEDGYADEEHSFYVRKGSRWHESGDDFQTDSEITLLKENNMSWLGISKEILKEYFEEVLDE